MRLKFIAAAVAIAAVPVYAQAQNKPPKMTKADVQKVVAMIAADKAKAQIYCAMSKLGEQMEQADQKKDTKAADALSKQMDDMSQKLGPQYVAMMDGLQDVDPNSKDGQEIGTMLETLDKQCTK
ncbi:MAG: hypothetical protein ACRECA_06245 [Pseudolabrys sp.]